MKKLLTCRERLAYIHRRLTGEEPGSLYVPGYWSLSRELGVKRSVIKSDVAIMRHTLGLPIVYHPDRDWLDYDPYTPGNSDVFNLADHLVQSSEFYE